MKDIYSGYIKNPFTPKKNSIKGVIIHNDAGSMTPSQYLNWLNKRVQNGQAELGFAALYVNRNECLWFSPTDHAEWHATNQVGNYNFIGFEVCESFSANNANFLANEDATLKKAAAIMKSYNLPVNRNTVMLHNEFAQTACPHRSWEIHIGKGAPYTQANKNILKDYFIKRIKHYMGGGTTSKPSSKPKPSNAGGWKKNKHGTWWKNKKGTFKNGDEPIIARYNGPFTNNPVSGRLPAGATIHFDEILLQDGHNWLGYTASNGKRVYLPVRTWNKVAPPKYKVGNAWGKLSWK